MTILDKLGKRWDEFYRRNFALKQDNWKNYTRIFPAVVEYGLGNLSHPVFGFFLRRLFRFDGKNSLAQSFIVPIDTKIEFNTGSYGLGSPEGDGTV